MSINNYIEVNRQSWNQRVALHVDSDFYDNESFKRGRSSLKEIELGLLGDVSGKSVLHLQCHFGQDSISLARMGAQVTAVDLSDQAIDRAKKMAEELQVDVNFICSDVYELPACLAQKFDVVFTSYGVIGWLPDMERWAGVVSHFLKPGGEFVFVEFHPVVWMFDDDFTKIAYSYNSDEAIVETLSGSYAAQDAEVQLQAVTWNHGLSHVFTALINQGLQIQQFEEFDYSPYPCFNDVVEFDTGKYRIQHLDVKIPMVYALKAIKSV